MERALSNRNSARIAEIDAELEKQQKELLRNANAKKGFDSIADKIETLRDEKHRLRLEDANNYGAKSRIAELEMFLDGLSGQIEEYDENAVIQLWIQSAHHGLPVKEIVCEDIHTGYIPEEEFLDRDQDHYLSFIDAEKILYPTEHAD